MTRFHLQKLFIFNNKGLLHTALFVVLALFFTTTIHAKQSAIITQFLTKTFQQDPPKSQRLWINQANKETIKRRHNPSHINLNYKYWQLGEKTIWILNEIGKERNITTGIVIENNSVKNVEVLIYRETRGGQVQNDRFTQQYKSKDINSNLIKEIDSISGATLSVDALNRQVKLALWLNTLK